MSVIPLYQRDDFGELIVLAAESKGIPNPAIVEKDYYVTEALRRISASRFDTTIFKGGTSLSKGWAVIERFSEDIDLYVIKGASNKATDKILKLVAEEVSAHPAFSEPERVAGINHIARSTRHYYTSRLEEGDGIEPSVLLELGIQSGTYPVEIRQIRSILAEVLQEKGQGEAMGEDGQPFPMRLLHYTRTVIEKMYALHDKVERGYLLNGKPVGSYARHYYDVYKLLQMSDVQAMFKNGGHIEICQDYRKLTNEYFPNQLLPANMNLKDSKALFPDKALGAVLSESYGAQCRTLCYGAFPVFQQVLEAFKKIHGYFADC